MFHCPARFSEMCGNCCNYNVEFASKKAGYTPMIDMLYLNLQGSWQCLFRFRSPSNLFCKCNFLGKTYFLIHFTGHYVVFSKCQVTREELASAAALCRAYSWRRGLGGQVLVWQRWSPWVVTRTQDVCNKSYMVVGTLMINSYTILCIYIIDAIFRGTNIHLPTIWMFTKGKRIWPRPQVYAGQSRMDGPQLNHPPHLNSLIRRHGD